MQEEVGCRLYVSEPSVAGLVRVWNVTVTQHTCYREGNKETEGLFIEQKVT
jgi:hypothetical protein